ncbi:MAG TPA: MauE/DoxX family redox-associated membrane protein [Gaiellaceae bacterium]|jgi:hypothetical protein|nr:MauE/DoxX family redox-associated membrane protein [Gaiellaceae bacterium]
MDIDALVYSLSAAPAAALTFSAIWKLRNGEKFAAALVAAAPIVGRYAHAAVAPTALLEIGSAAALLAQPVAGRLGAAPAVFAFIVFVVVRRRTDSTGGCGCWRTVAADDPETERRVLVGRNFLLLVMAAVALALPAAPASSGVVFGVASGALIGFVLMEAPGIVALATIQRHAEVTR